MRPITALVPIKSRAQCKTRLQHHLDGPQRLLLVRNMLNHELKVLTKHKAVGRIVVLTPERDTLDPKVEILHDQGCDLNSSLTLALQHLKAEGEERVLILPADLACLDCNDVDQLLAAGNSTAAVIAPSEDGTGTNALLIPLNTAFTLSFGHHSFQAHLRQFKQVHCTFSVVTSRGLGFDVDTETDLTQVHGRTLACIEGERRTAR